MQIHELNSFTGTPGADDYLVIDDGTETSKLAATGLLDLFYPVGSYYETSDTSFNPNNTWGGTWVLETAGMVHVSAGNGYFYLVSELDGGGKVKLFFDGINAPGEYTLTPDDVTFESGNPDNYSLEYIDNELTVMKLG